MKIWIQIKRNCLLVMKYIVAMGGRLISLTNNDLIIYNIHIIIKNLNYSVSSAGS